MSNSPYRTLVIKLGTNVLTSGTDRLDLEVMASVADQVVQLRDAGARIVLVSSGAIAAGRDAMGTSLGRSRSVGNLQVLAAIGQSRLMQAYDRIFASRGITSAQALLTRHDLRSKRAANNARRTLEGLLDAGALPIVNENDVVATEEIGPTFGDNDTLSATVANLVAADLLVLITDQKGLYDRDPRVHADANLIPRVDRITEDVIRASESLPSERGRGGMASKVRAAAEVTSWGTAVVIAGLSKPDALLRIAAGEPEGTFFAPARRHTTSRKRPLGRAFVTGAIIVDQGAVEALRTGRSSLLPVGVREVRGAFEAGDVVEILDPSNVAVARGTAAYASDLVDKVKGFRSAEALAILGGAGAKTAAQEVVHLDNLALL